MILMLFLVLLGLIGILLLYQNTILMTMTTTGNAKRTPSDEIIMMVDTKSASRYASPIKKVTSSIEHHEKVHPNGNDVNGGSLSKEPERAAGVAMQSSTSRQRHMAGAGSRAAAAADEHRQDPSEWGTHGTHAHHVRHHGNAKVVDRLTSVEEEKEEEDEGTQLSWGDNNFASSQDDCYSDFLSFLGEPEKERGTRWTFDCPACTYLNENTHSLVCSICGTRAPATKARAVSPCEESSGGSYGAKRSHVSFASEAPSSVGSSSAGSQVHQNDRVCVLHFSFSYMHEILQE